MRSTKVLVLLASIISFQPLQATYPTTQQNSSESALIVKSKSTSKESVSFFGRAKQFLSSWLRSFTAPSSQEVNKTWETEWDQLVGHVAQENAKHIKNLFMAMYERRSEYASAHDQGFDAYYKKLKTEKSLREKVSFIRNEDQKLAENLDTGLLFLLKELAQETDSYLELQDVQAMRKALSNPDYRNRIGDIYTKARGTTLDQDFYDGNLFDQGHLLMNSLSNILSLERTAENLPVLKEKIKTLYTKRDDGRLSESSLETLSSLGMNFGKPRVASSWFTPERIGTGFTLLLVSSSAFATVSMLSRIPMAKAARPIDLDGYCSTTEFNYGTCESSFGVPIEFNTEIATIKNNPYFQQIITDKILQANRASSIVDTLGRLGSMSSQFYGEIITSRTGSFSGGNVTFTTYFDTNSPLGMQDAPKSSSQYDRIAFNLTTYSDSSRQTISSYVRTGPIEPSYYGQIPNSERMILALQPLNDTSFVYGVIVDRPFGGTPMVVREGIITSPTNPIYPDLLTTTPVNNVNPNGLLPVESVENLVSRIFYNGDVAGTDGLNRRPVSQYFDDIGFSTSSNFLAVKNCLEGSGVSPLACSSQFAQNSGFTTALYVYATQPNSVVTLSRNLLQGTNYTEGTYQAGSGNVLETLMSYTWNPSLSTATRTNSTLSIPMSTLRGTSPLNQIDKIWIYNPDPANSELGYVVRTTQNSSGTSTSYYVVPGVGITIFPPNPTTPTGPTPTDPTSPTTPGTPPKSSGLSDGAKIGIGVGVGGAALLTAAIVGVGCGLKNKGKKNNSYNAAPPTDSTPLRTVITRENFNATDRGLLSGIVVTGTLAENQYNLVFKVTKEKLDEIVKATGLKMEFKPDVKQPNSEEEPVMDLIIGGGSFGQVRIARDISTQNYVAVKIVPGNDKVKSSLREGTMQHRLAGQLHVLPLLNYLHYTPATDKAASSELLKLAFGNAKGKNEDLLLQFTPLASFGDGEILRDRLSLLKDAELKEKIVTYVAYCFIDGLMNMHNNGVSHLDFKLSNLLLSWSGEVWDADLGCAVQKTFLSGGLGDFRYFSPKRLEHLRYLSAKKKNPSAFKGDLKATFSGHKADDFAAGLTILEMFLGKHPFQKLFDQRKKGTGIPTSMIETWSEEMYTKGLDEAFIELDGVVNDKLLKVIRDLTALSPTEKQTTTLAQKALEKLLPTESGEELFRQFDQALLDAYKQEHPDEVDTAELYYHTPKPAQYEKINEDGDAYYKDFPSSGESSGQVYGQELSVYQDLQQPYVDLPPDTDEPTYTVLTDPSSSKPPRRKEKEPSEDQ